MFIQFSNLVIQLIKFNVKFAQKVESTQIWNYSAIVWGMGAGKSNQPECDSREL